MLKFELFFKWLKEATETINHFKCQYLMINELEIDEHSEEIYKKAIKVYEKGS